jgi:hypothetical protein
VQAKAVRHATIAHRKLPKIEFSACRNHGVRGIPRQFLFTDKI